MVLKYCRFSILILIALFSGAVNAQVKPAVAHYKALEYADAIPLYKKVVKSPKNIEYSYDLADCYFQLRDYKSAAEYYLKYINESEKVKVEVLAKADTIETVLPNGQKENKVVSNVYDEQHCKKTIAYLYYGEALMSLSKYDLAREQFKTYNKINPADKRGALFIRACDDIVRWTTMPNRYKVFSIPKINSTSSDFGAVEFHGGLAFVSDRNEDIFNENIAGQTHSPYLGMLYVKQKDAKDSIAFGNVHDFLLKYKGDYHTGPIAFNAGEDEVWISRVDEFKGRITDKDAIHKAKLYQAKRKGNKWTDLAPFAYNSSEYSIAQPSVAPDNQTIYFVSDMDGGFGGKDIWYSKREGDSWAKPQNCGERINTSGNEEFPFISNNNILYFSSDGHEGMGGMDVYSSSIISNSFTDAINLKGEINSPFDDFSFYMHNDNLKGYFSSNRPNGMGSDDVYGFRVNPNIVNITGKILLSENIKDGAENVKIYLMTSEGKVLQTTTSDNSGFFKFENIKSDEYYVVKVDENDPVLQKKRTLFMADEKERLVKVTVVSKDGYFVFESLPSDLTILDELQSSDIPIRYLLVNGILYGASNPDLALSGITIKLLGDNNNALQTRITNDKGAFSFNNILPSQKYTFGVDDSSPVISKESKIIIKDEKGNIIYTIERNSNGSFAFELLSTDEKSLALVEEEDPSNNKSFGGKLLSASDNSPIPFARIKLVNKRNEVLQTGSTDVFGNFKFFNILSTQDLEIKTDETDAIYAKYDKIKITDASGNVLFYAERKKDGFTFELLRSDNNTLSLIDEEDRSTLKINIKGKLESGDGSFKPIAGSKVNALDEKGNIIASTTTDVNGNFEFKNLPADQKYIIKIEENDPVAASYSKIIMRDDKGKEIYSSSKDNTGAFNFVVLPSDKTMLQEIEVLDESEAFEMTGFMIAGDGDNAPIPNATVKLLNEQGIVIGRSVTSDKGKFRFTHLRSSEKYIVAIDSEDPALTQYNNVILTDKNGKIYATSRRDRLRGFHFELLVGENKSLALLEEMDVKLFKELKGYLTNENAAIANARVFLQNKEGKQLATAVTNEKGFFRFRNLASNEDYSLNIDANDPALVNQKTIYIKDEKGNIVLKTVNDEKVGFVFNVLATDTKTLALLDEYDVSLTKQLAGYMINEETGKPIASAKIKLINKTNNIEVGTANTDAQGYFIFKGLNSTQDYQVSLDVNDPALTAVHTIVIKDAGGVVILKTVRDEKQGFVLDLLASDSKMLSLMEEEDSRLKVDIIGKLLTEEVGLKAVKGARLLLKDNEGNVIQSVATDDAGVFRFVRLFADENYSVDVDPEDVETKKHKTLILADAKGKVVKRVVADKDGMFKFEILQVDQAKLSMLNENDYMLALNRKSSSTKQAVINQAMASLSEDESRTSFTEGELVDKIYYDYAMCSINPSSKVLIDKIIKVMKSDNSLTLEVNGFADSRGKSEYNYVLSRMRRDVVVNYMVSKGITKNRLTGKAYGETNLTNGCMDGVECTEEQHRENRRADIKGGAKILPQVTNKKF